MTRDGTHPLDPVRTHRRLIRLGYMLLTTGPVLALTHLLSDARWAEGTWWTYTVASYDVALIMVIGAVALVLRKPPRPAAGTDRPDTNREH